MPFWVEGWIEVTHSPDLWFGVVDLGSLIEVADADTERLFGLSKLCVGGDKSVDALAANRGVPPNPSKNLKQALDSIAEHEAKHGPGEFGGYTYALWSEIRGYELTEPPEDSQCRLPFALAHVLEERYSPDRIRFVVWFNW